MSTIIENCGQTEYGHDRRIHMKGASEYVFKSCTHFMDENGQKIPITDVNQQQFSKIIDFYANQSLRTISLAYKDLKANQGGPKHD